MVAMLTCSFSRIGGIETKSNIPMILSDQKRRMAMAPKSRLDPRRIMKKMKLTNGTAAA
jgi:hypothetical protein